MSDEVKVDFLEERETNMGENGEFGYIRENPNLMSKWIDAVKDCGIRIPRTIILRVPDHIIKAFFMEHFEEDRKKIEKYVEDVVLPAIPSSFEGPRVFIKNGCFSNKFDFSTCTPRRNVLDVTRSLMEINYTSLLFDVLGESEIVIREMIPTQDSSKICIYNGMPLLNEYRVFYDFHRHIPLYISNYWDWDYCHDSICRNATDKIVYEAVYPAIAAHYNNQKDKVFEMVAEAMKNVTELNGVWSVDVMEDDKGDFWLIDMAIGQQSAYWNPQKCM